MVKKEVLNKKTITIIAAAELFIILILLTVIVADANNKADSDALSIADAAATTESVSETTAEVHREEWNLILVNQDNKITENYSVHLTQLEIRLYSALSNR